ncbi:hypothetical protein CPB84DRAFT_1416834 [Gymnopilus junonius]|uniref:Uncharacterized protein n=1 Tax=Gymnopilus junonius TaxID=109634 RepID=A0A9P5NJ52_GYMJU|nr:hypothetical protein CPB84DRAFT_1416834 [Gymnopilus junonius]
MVYFICKPPLLTKGSWIARRKPSCSCTTRNAETLGCSFLVFGTPPKFLTSLPPTRRYANRVDAWSLEYDNGFHAMMKLPDGPEQDQRDIVLAQSMVHGDWDHMDETVFRSVWGNELAMYSQ